MHKYSRLKIHYQHVILSGWCSFMHIIDYGIISTCVLHPILVGCSFMQIIDYDIMLGLRSFMHIIIIYMSE